ncbi:MAG: hypothetical protein K5784_04155 [Clostridiales bacterium]|nr:hypothetical protein [Clostridiales bacterium]
MYERTVSGVGEAMVPQAVVDALIQQITSLQATIDRLTAIIEEKNQIILNQNRARFGQSSEKRTYILNDGQLSLFERVGDGITDKAQADAAAEDVKSVTVGAHKRKAKRTLEELCADLPVEEIISDLPEKQKISADGYPLKCIGIDEVRTELVREPSRIFVRKYYCRSYADPRAEARTGYAVIKRAYTPAPLLEHSYASASVVTNVIMDANGRYCIWSEPINVKYAGEEPLILVQPSSIVLKPDQNGFTLSCYAISGTGDNSGIIYAWYYWQKSNLISGLGEWKLSEVENKGRVTDYREGLYRCMVTDMSTGKHAWSDIATVCDELVFVGIKETIRWSNTSRFELSFKGGSAPYTVTIFLKWAEWQNDHYEYSDRVYLTDTIYSAAELAQLEYDLDSSYMVPRNSDNGMGWENTMYYIVVTDAIGNKSESPEFYSGKYRE